MKENRIKVEDANIEELAEKVSAIECTIEDLAFRKAILRKRMRTKS